MFSLRGIFFKFEAIMDSDIWGQLAFEPSSVYLTDGSKRRTPFADTVKKLHNNRIENISIIKNICLFC